MPSTDPARCCLHPPMGRGSAGGPSVPLSTHPVRPLAAAINPCLPVPRARLHGAGERELGAAIPGGRRRFAMAPGSALTTCLPAHAGMIPGQRSVAPCPPLALLPRRMGLFMALRARRCSGCSGPFVGTVPPGTLPGEQGAATGVGLCLLVETPSVPTDLPPDGSSGSPLWDIPTWFAGWRDLVASARRLLIPRLRRKRRRSP